MKRTTKIRIVKTGKGLFFEKRYNGFFQKKEMAYVPLKSETWGDVKSFILNLDRGLPDLTINRDNNDFCLTLVPQTKRKLTIPKSEVTEITVDFERGQITAKKNNENLFCAEICYLGLGRINLISLDFEKKVIAFYKSNGKGITQPMY